MNFTVTEVDVVSNEALGVSLNGAYFADTFLLTSNAPSHLSTDTALKLFVRMVSRTPAWVKFLMSLRNRIVAVFGLKTGAISIDHPDKSEADYKPGQRIGIFTLQHILPNEVVVGETDSHLDFKILLRRSQTDSTVTVSATTVVHVHNWLGRIYMFFVGPVHKRIVPLMLKQLAESGE